MTEWWNCGGSLKEVEWTKIWSLLVTDKDAFELSDYAESRKEEVQIYVEHVVSTVEPIEFIEWTQSGTKSGGG